MKQIIWPERPTCHDADGFAQRFAPPSWHAKGVKLHPENDDVPAFRSCSYCGSMHPEDLVAALNAGARLGGSDWKYGWPHKFYVDDIPNPYAGRLVSRVSSSGPGEPKADDRARMERYVKPGGKVIWTQEESRWKAKVMEPDGPTTNGKWYNEHLKDLNDEAFAELSALLHKHAHILFVKKDGKIGYTAPCAGYQAS